MTKRRGNRWKHADLIVKADGWTEWEFPRHNGYKTACCDCGLVHTVDYRVGKGPIRTREGGRVSRANGHVMLRVKRDNRSTAMLRRYKAPTINQTFMNHACASLVALYVACPNQLEGFLQRFRANVLAEIEAKG